jgi:hypothetical protein
MGPPENARRAALAGDPVSHEDGLSTDETSLGSVLTQAAARQLAQKVFGTGVQHWTPGVLGRTRDGLRWWRATRSGKPPEGGAA